MWVFFGKRVSSLSSENSNFPQPWTKFQTRVLLKSSFVNKHESGLVSLLSLLKLDRNWTSFYAMEYDFYYLEKSDRAKNVNIFDFGQILSPVYVHGYWANKKKAQKPIFSCTVFLATWCAKNSRPRSVLPTWNR